MLNQNMLDDIRDFIKDTLVDGKIGSDGTQTSLSDTSLGSEISGSSATLTKNTFHNGVSISYTSPSGISGEAREFGASNSSGALRLRAVMPEIDLETDDTLNIDTQILIIQELVE